MTLLVTGLLIGFIMGVAAVFAEEYLFNGKEPEEDALTRAQRPPIDTRLKLIHEGSEYILPQGSKESEAILGILDTWLAETEEVF